MAADKYEKTDHVINDLFRMHHAETCFLRQVPIILSLSNNGQEPASEVEIELLLSNKYDISLSPNDSNPTLTVIGCSHDDMKNDTDQFKLVRLIHQSKWYGAAPAENNLPPRAPSYEALRVAEVSGQKAQFRAAMKKLKHGKSIDLSCIYIKFGYSDSADVEIEYKIYADNVPSVGNGKITVHVSDS
jgi:hypothetical protein